jgi:hypothetical protein
MEQNSNGPDNRYKVVCRLADMCRHFAWLSLLGMGLARHHMSGALDRLAQVLLALGKNHLGSRGHLRLGGNLQYNLGERKQAPHSLGGQAQAQ